MSAVIDNTL